MEHQADVIIIGGGINGSSVAYNLLHDGFTGKVVVFEKDKAYEYASTPRCAGGFRQLYTTEVNIRISRYSLNVYKHFAEEMALNGEKPDIGFKQRGYLFLATEKMIPSFEKNMAVQHRNGVPSRLLDSDELRDLIPELNVSDLAGGLYCPESGYLDAYSVMQGYIKYARHLGAEYIYEEVSALIIDEHDRMKGVRLKNGDTCAAPVIVNCGGAWGADLSAQAGILFPIVPSPRQIFQFTCEKKLTRHLPLTMDPTGVYFRHEGEQLIAGYSEPIRSAYDFSWRREDFIEHVWPVLAGRIVNFERLKIVRGWAGIYDYNTEDHNAIIGKCPGVEGYYVAFGFSGHGMQQAPGVGKGLSELIRTGKYETIDLSPLRPERFAEHQLVVEDAIY
ncbi:FAD-binding oxidoreductase [Sporolactobacillus sp. THM7-4]|nr:FAD-binding oxidoreductase [Sporolactobacillus sp. THM7-4]